MFLTVFLLFRTLLNSKSASQFKSVLKTRDTTTKIVYNGFEVSRLDKLTKQLFYNGFDTSRQDKQTTLLVDLVFEAGRSLCNGILMRQEAKLTPAPSGPGLVGFESNSH